MRRTFFVLLAISMIIITSACGTKIESTQVQAPSPTTASSNLSTPEAGPAQADDFFTQNGISLPAPACSGLTQAQTEGPYYKADTPQRNSLLDEGMQGTPLIVVGYVLDQNCNRLANAWLDFWQADANGKYDNAGYTLRGHQFTDAQGRYYLNTIRPGEYPGRTEHIHVKVQPQGGQALTTQIYFPDVTQNQQDGIFDPSLVVKLEDRGDHLLAYFNFVVP